MKFSMIDLYLMGLATPAEVTPFGVLENVTPPANVPIALKRGGSPIVRQVILASRRSPAR